MAALPSLTETEAHMEAYGEHGPELLGLSAEGWVYVGISIFFLVAIFVFKAHRKITEGLDARIADARKSLDEAEKIRGEAEALLAEAKAQQAKSTSDAAAIIDHARGEADRIVDQAKADTTAMIERRKEMAQQKISAAERSAVDELRAKVAVAAAYASRQIISEKHGEAEDRELADKLIAEM